MVRVSGLMPAVTEDRGGETRGVVLESRGRGDREDEGPVRQRRPESRKRERRGDGPHEKETSGWIDRNEQWAEEPLRKRR